MVRRVCRPVRHTKRGSLLKYSQHTNVINSLLNCCGQKKKKNCTPMDVSFITRPDPHLEHYNKYSIPVNNIWVNNTVSVSTSPSLLITLTYSNVLYPGHTPKQLVALKYQGASYSGMYFIFLLVHSEPCMQTRLRQAQPQQIPMLLHSQQSNWGGSPKGSSHTAEHFATDKLKWQRR